MKSSLRLPEDLANGLMDFFSEEISDNIFAGVTYGLVFKDKMTQAKVAKYTELKQKILECEMNTQDKLRMFEVCNGYIFDLGVRTAQIIALDLIRSTYKDGEEISKNDVLRIKDLPVQRRRAELERLANKCIKIMNDNRTSQSEEIVIALYSRNTSNTVKVTGELENGQKVRFTYDAYKLKHTDLDELNKQFLVKRRIKVASIQACEILPPRTGVKFKLKIERLDDKMKIDMRR